MKINKTIQTPEGIIKFEGELSEKEADLVIEAGLSTLLRMGLFSQIYAAQQNEAEQAVIVHEENKTLQ